MLRPLGRRVPTDDNHIRQYGLTVDTLPTKPVPITIGINWYTNFDKPVYQNGRYWIGKGKLGSVRGGHCVCIKPDSLTDAASWRVFYNQGEEGACVGFGSSRMMTLLNRVRYDARWLWNQAKAVDEWPDTNPGDDNGTSVRAAMDVLRATGHVRSAKTEKPPSLAEGIAANRWATTVDMMRAALKSPSHDTLQAFPILNSWGTDYPRIVWLPYTVMTRLLKEDGESTLVTDR